MDKEMQKAIFYTMLCNLELLGKCSSKYHDLAFELFGDRLEN